MYKFNESNIMTGYIKELLFNFNLPKAKVWHSGMQVYANNYYIGEGYLVKSLYTGIFNSIDSYFDYQQTKKAFSKVSPYYYGQSFPNVTKNLKLNNLLYDSYTHNYLGDYLRFYRDYKGINLMPLYNCFSNEQPKNFSVELTPIIINNPFYENSGLYYSGDIPSVSVSDNNLNITGSVNDVNVTVDTALRTIYKKFDSSDENYITYMIPVKFGKQYTISIDCNFSIECFCGLYSTHHITDADLNTVSSIKSLEEFTYKKKTDCKFNKPFVYDKLINAPVTDIIYNQEANLKLFIKIPASNKSSIVVLEGDYTADTNIMPDGTLYQATPLYQEIITNPLVIGTTKLQLLKFNSGVQHPFSNRLMEYLLNNVINSDDEISDNIKRVQKELAVGINVNGEVRSLSVNKYGVWDDSIRDFIYNLEKDKIINGSVANNNVKTFLDSHYDVLGYVDKDIEPLIKGGK